MNLNLRQHVTEAYNWATGKTAREQEHTRNRLIRELAQSIQTLRETPGLAAQAREDYAVRHPLAKPLMDLYHYTDAETRQVISGALDAVTAIDPVLAADWMQSVTNYGRDRSVMKSVGEKLIALSGELPYKEARSALGSFAIYVESLRDAVAEKIIAHVSALPQDEALKDLSQDAMNDYMSAPKFVPAVLALAAKEGMTVEQKTEAYRVAALRGMYDQELWTKAISDWESAVTKDLPVDKGLKAALSMLGSYHVKDDRAFDPVRQAAVRAVNLLAPQATDPEEQRSAAHELLGHAPRGGVEWNRAMQTDLAALDKLPLARSVEVLAWYGRPASESKVDEGKLAAKWAEIVARSKPEDLVRAIMARLYDGNDNYRQKIGPVEHLILQTWIDLQSRRPVEDAWRDAHRVAQPHGSGYSDYNVLREALRREYLPQLLVTLADKLPAATALEAVHDAIAIADNGPAAAGVAQKWGTVVRGLDPQVRLKEAYRIAEGQTKNASLRAEAVAVEQETCKEFACGMTPQAFLSSIAGGPRV